MAVVSIKNKLRRGNLLAGNDPYIPTDFESIATVTVGSGGAANVEFTSIPATYTHLQVRILTRDNRAVDNGNPFNIRINSDSGSNYATHALSGNGTSASAVAYSSTTTINTPFSTSADDAANIFSTLIIDILDYSNTNKNTTVRGLNGFDRNGSGTVLLFSGLWNNTAAVNSLLFFSNGSADIVQYSHFALYGIKGA